MMKGIFKSLKYIISGTLTNENLLSCCDYYMTIIKNEINRDFDRTSKTPFTRWYIKEYMTIYKFDKIINAILNDTIDKLEDNLKVIAKTITIIK